ncbi:MAG: L,D-transpeptidase family protein [Dactylosporangium sp.]|nr:L,D-transpeptidase family protein [Dactylosporangium sp.]NNJ61268.1 L,D-transpeptidase family protein [Dactylosporangium sp.]
MIAVMLGITPLIASCGAGTASWREPGDAQRDQAPNITITQPADNAADVPTSTEIEYTASDATESSVELFQLPPAAADASAPASAAPSAGASATPSAGQVAVPGTLRADGSSWVAAKQLKYSTRYTAKVTATVKGKKQSKAITFTTMAKPSSTLRVSSVIGDDQVVGVGMPVIIKLGGDVPKDQRAAVQRRLFVTAEPAQEGIWHWFNGHEVHFRPREYWQANTKLSFRAALGGLPLGNDRYGANDITVSAKIGPQLIMAIDNRTKQMTVTENGTVLKTIPVSLGKPSSPSASGHLVIMAKNQEEWFDSSTYGVPADSTDGYRTLVQFTQRLTWDGEYIHAAPWSVGDQGRRNVSHGCTNISGPDAEWLFGITHIGDPVTITHTEEHVTWGNGYTDWDISYAEYAKGSALPPPSQSASASPLPSQS